MLPVCLSIQYIQLLILFKFKAKWTFLCQRSLSAKRNMCEKLTSDALIHVIVRVSTIFLAVTLALDMEVITELHTLCFINRHISP
mmetsp:Transcript_19545/g.25769  ORF Transcript_19545/g.25769 Transcript_19545/m.25769 type:complete len:85 (-) Transcript_19545:1433-1687(-)